MSKEANFAFSGDFEDDDEQARLDAEAEAAEKNAVWSVAVYLVDRSYGGPEEGGWWFDYGEPQLEQWLPMPEFYGDKERALEARDKMQALLDVTVNEGRRPISSVLSEGIYRAQVEMGWPKPYPDQRPHYE